MDIPNDMSKGAMLSFFALMPIINIYCDSRFFYEVNKAPTMEVTIAATTKVMAMARAKQRQEQ